MLLLVLIMGRGGLAMFTLFNFYPHGMLSRRSGIRAGLSGRGQTTAWSAPRVCRPHAVSSKGLPSLTHDRDLRGQSAPGIPNPNPWGPTKSRSERAGEVFRNTKGPSWLHSHSNPPMQLHSTPSPLSGAQADTAPARRQGSHPRQPQGPELGPPAHPNGPSCPSVLARALSRRRRSCS